MSIVGGIGGLTPSNLLGIIWTGIGLAIIFVILRTAIRIHVFHRLFLDDACVYFALVVLIAIGALYTYAIPIMFEAIHIEHGEESLTLGFVTRAEFFLRLQFAIIVLYWTSLWAVKFSFLMFYKKLMVGLPRSMMMWHGVCGFTMLAYLSCQGMNLGSCKPLSYYFVLGACQTKRDIYVSNLSLYTSTAADLTCDLLIMTLPLRLLWNLQINKKQKCALAAVFSLGIIIMIFAIVRVIETSPAFDHVDPIWLALWSMTEASVGKPHPVIVASLPSFHVLLNSRTSSAFNRRNHPFPSPGHQGENAFRLGSVHSGLSADPESAGGGVLAGSREEPDPLKLEGNSALRTVDAVARNA